MLTFTPRICIFFSSSRLPLSIPYRLPNFCMFWFLNIRGIHGSPNRTQIVTQITPNLGPKLRFEDLGSWSSRGPNAQMHKSSLPKSPKYRYPITGATNTCKKAGTIAAATAAATAAADPVIPPPSTIRWKDHPEWTDQLVASLLQHPHIRLRLFSDAAKVENCAKVTSNGSTKKDLLGKLAGFIWDIPEEDEKECPTYLIHKAKFITSLDGRISK